MLAKRRPGQSLATSHPAIGAVPTASRSDTVGSTCSPVQPLESSAATTAGIVANASARPRVRSSSSGASSSPAGSMGGASAYTGVAGTTGSARSTRLCFKHFGHRGEGRASSKRAPHDPQRQCEDPDRAAALQRSPCRVDARDGAGAALQAPGTSSLSPTRSSSSSWASAAWSLASSTRSANAPGGRAGAYRRRGGGW